MLKILLLIAVGIVHATTAKPCLSIDRGLNDHVSDEDLLCHEELIDLDPYTRRGLVRRNKGGVFRRSSTNSRPLARRNNAPVNTYVSSNTDEFNLQDQNTDWLQTIISNTIENPNFGSNNVPNLPSDTEGLNSQYQLSLQELLQNIVPNVVESSSFVPSSAQNIFQAPHDSSSDNEELSSPGQATFNTEILQDMIPNGIETPNFEPSVTTNNVLAVQHCSSDKEEQTSQEQAIFNTELLGIPSSEIENANFVSSIIENNIPVLPHSSSDNEESSSQDQATELQHSFSSNTIKTPEIDTYAIEDNVPVFPDSSSDENELNSQNTFNADLLETNFQNVLDPPSSITEEKEPAFPHSSSDEELNLQDQATELQHSFSSNTIETPEIDAYAIEDNVNTDLLETNFQNVFETPSSITEEKEPAFPHSSSDEGLNLQDQATFNMGLQATPYNEIETLDLGSPTTEDLQLDSVLAVLPESGGFSSNEETFELWQSIISSAMETPIFDPAASGESKLALPYSQSDEKVSSHAQAAVGTELLQTITSGAIETPNFEEHTCSGSVPQDSMQSSNKGEDLAELLNMLQQSNFVNAKPEEVALFEKLVPEDNGTEFTEYASEEDETTDIRDVFDSYVAQMHSVPEEEDRENEDTEENEIELEGLEPIDDEDNPKPSEPILGAQKRYLTDSVRPVQPKGQQLHSQASNRDDLPGLAPSSDFLDEILVRRDPKTQKEYFCLPSISNSFTIEETPQVKGRSGEDDSANGNSNSTTANPKAQVPPKKKKKKTKKNGLGQNNLMASMMMGMMSMFGGMTGGQF